jgi:glycosyltransferase involved in cell wall biosynthesis
MIGGAPEQVERYRGVAHQAGLEGHCLFTGAMAPGPARKLLERSDVLTSPRIEGTNTPLKIYEQLASGKPLVATRILSHTQVLNDDVCFLADPDAASMGEAIRAALNDRERAGRVAAAARELYEREYSRPAYEGKMRRLLELLG